MSLLAHRTIPSSGVIRARAVPGSFTSTRRSSRSVSRISVGAKEKQASATESVVFQPNEVKNELAAVSNTNADVASFSRVNFHEECEAAINEQINIEYNVSYVYHSLHAYFDRDNVGLPGFAKFFKDASDEERSHAELLMQYQNKRGGRVSLKSIAAPEGEYDNAEKGDALYAMELALSLEKLNFQKLRELHEVADKHGDAAMTNFVEGELLADQVASVRKSAELVSQLRRVGKGMGVYIFDRELAEGK